MARGRLARRGRAVPNGEELDKPMSLVGGIVTLFMGTGCLLLLGGFVLILENYAVMWRLWIRLYKYLAGLDFSTQVNKVKRKILKLRICRKIYL